MTCTLSYPTTGLFLAIDEIPKKYPASGNTAPGPSSRDET